MLSARLNEIVRQYAPRHTVADLAPSTEVELWSPRGDLVVWSGSSDTTIFGDPAVNWAFRAWHDSLHLHSGLGFGYEHEIEMGRRHAAMFDGQVADMIYLEIAGQAKYHRDTGLFVENQMEWTITQLQHGVVK